MSGYKSFRSSDGSRDAGKSRIWPWNAAGMGTRTQKSGIMEEGGVGMLDKRFKIDRTFLRPHGSWDEVPLRRPREQVWKGGWRQMPPSRSMDDVYIGAV